MQKSKKSSSCGCFGVLFKSKKKNEAKRNTSSNEVQVDSHQIQNAAHKSIDPPTERRAKTDTNFYQPQKPMLNENDSLPGYQAYYKSTIVSNLSKSHGNGSFHRGQTLPTNQKLPLAPNEPRPDSQESTRKFLFDARKQATPPFHDISGIQFMNLPQIPSRPFSHSSVPNLFDTQNFKNKPIGPLPHLTPATPWRFKRNNIPTSARDNNRFENILSDLKKELEEEPRVVID
ncbi:unnamed protein product [Blepharisma stoltei]|uniref:Uncharacterized protein n=1 Tax=Blepharisma stoltei TaxID=1481888 RepID=A0AAU9IN50_9CILI|nr:unnamed protein product [Blepharisma stoltei]